MLPASFKPRILCVSIYDEMAQLVRHSAGQFGVEVDVFDGGIYNSGHLHALEVENRYDVIISQAGTAIAIQQMVKTPVVSYTHLTLPTKTQGWVPVGRRSASKNMMTAGYD